MKRGKSNTGQVALIVALSMAVMATVTLSVVSQSVVDLRLTAVDEESSAALKAAEAGLEQALKNLTSSDFSDSFSDATYSVDVENEGGSGFLSNVAVRPGEMTTIDLGDTPPSSVRVWWGDEADASQSPAGAVQIIKYGKVSDSDYRVRRFLYDPDSLRRGQNSFSSPDVGGTFLSTDFAASIEISLSSDDDLLRIRVLYNSATIGVEPLGGTLPSQVYKAVAVGEAGDNVQRKVEAVREEAQLPAMFDAALYSGSSL